MTPTLIEGGISVDDRGQVSFVNGFDFSGVKRFYTVRNHRAGFVRAWHGHKKEAKYVMAIQGSALVCAVEMNDSISSDIYRFVLSVTKPSVLHIPAGYANGWMSLTDDATLMFFSDATVAESNADDIRFHVYHWNPWGIEER